MTDPDRIAHDRSHPRIIDLWFAMQGLKSVISFMNTGAHPDDETSGMLAALAFRDGLTTSFACANRGEGGQNNIGKETGADLGTIRTAEMERAAEVLNMNLYWLSETPDDSIFDFGFSKSGSETLSAWGRERTLKRFVEIVRMERPDIICPTFLDVPGQHGHHRAMTEAAGLVMKAAADPDYDPGTLPAWQVKKLYLPAWSGSGQSYDDDLPPPPASVIIDGSGSDPATGWTWEQIGQQSRAFHKTQGMGKWIPPGIRSDWPLHLAATELTGTDDQLGSGLPENLGALAEYSGAGEIADPLSEAQDAVEAIFFAFPNRQAISHHAARALKAVRMAAEQCPDHARSEVIHRLDRKELELGRVLRLSVGVRVSARVNDDWLRPGDTTELSLETWKEDAEDLKVFPRLPKGWYLRNSNVEISPEADVTDPYPASFLPMAPRKPLVEVKLTSRGVTSTTRIPFETTPVVLPAGSGRLVPDNLILNTRSGNTALSTSAADMVPRDAKSSLHCPPGWSLRSNSGTFDVEAPEDVKPGLHTLPLRLDGNPASSVVQLNSQHTGPRARSAPAVLRVRVLEAEIPGSRVGYLGGGQDQVAESLRALGVDLTELDAQTIDERLLEHFDTIVTGIFAMKFCVGLVAAIPAIHGWIENGGTLVTLYHRPWDNWDPETIPPRRLEIGQPSLRWRVTDQTAAVRHLAPDHPILNHPNKIVQEDWTGWQKERGLYFASSWDPAYVPLVEMADPGEAPHSGALLAADIGKGRHVHTSLILHHQMRMLVPWAFRIMANLLSRRDR